MKSRDEKRENRIFVTKKRKFTSVYVWFKSIVDKSIDDKEERNALLRIFRRHVNGLQCYVKTAKKQIRFTAGVREDRRFATDSIEPNNIIRRRKFFNAIFRLIVTVFAITLFGNKRPIVYAFVTFLIDRFEPSSFRDSFSNFIEDPKEREELLETFETEDRADDEVENLKVYSKARKRLSEKSLESTTSIVTRNRSNNAKIARPINIIRHTFAQPSLLKSKKLILDWSHLAKINADFARIRSVFHRLWWDESIDDSRENLYEFYSSFSTTSTLPTNREISKDTSVRGNLSAQIRAKGSPYSVSWISPLKYAKRSA